jgi:hypothetical protein
MSHLTHSPGDSMSTDVDPPALDAKPRPDGPLKSGTSNFVLGVKHRSYWQFIAEQAKSVAKEPPKASG